MAKQGNLLSKTLVIGIIISLICMSVVPSSGTICKTASIYKSNNPPYEPSDPIPPDGAENWIKGGPCWTGGDPDGDDVLYDVYFGEYSPPPLLSENQSSNCTDLPFWLFWARLKRYTIYYWKVVARDEHGASTEGPIWSFTWENYPPVPKIDCYEINLDFSDVNPGAYVIGQIIIQNVGDPGSFLNWEVDTTNVPTWGTWKFIPESGTNLSQGDIAICDVEVQLTNKVGEYTGRIIIYNSDDPTDYCWVSVSGNIVISRNRASVQSLFQFFFDIFPLLERLFFILFTNRYID